MEILVYESHICIDNQLLHEQSFSHACSLRVFLEETTRCHMLACCPIVVLLLLTCLLTPEPVTSSHRPSAAPTVHVHVASSGRVAIISGDVHNQRF